MASEYKQFTNEDCDVEGVVNDICDVSRSCDETKQPTVTTASTDESNQSSAQQDIEQQSPTQQDIQHPPHNPSESPTWQPPQLPKQHSQYAQQQPGNYNVGVQQQQGAPGAQLQAPEQMNIVRVSTWSKPNDHFVLALIVTLLFCCPIGISALVSSCEVRRRLEKGDLAGAAQASEEAKKRSIAGIICGFVCSAINGVIIFFLVSTFSKARGDY